MFALLAPLLKVFRVIGGGPEKNGKIPPPPKLNPTEGVGGR